MATGLAAMIFIYSLLPIYVAIHEVWGRRKWCLGVTSRRARGLIVNAYEAIVLLLLSNSLGLFYSYVRSTQLFIQGMDQSSSC